MMPYRLIAIIVGILGLALGVYMKGRIDERAVCNADKAATAAVVAKVMVGNAQREAALTAELADTRVKMARDTKDAEDNHARIVAGLQSGAIKLRKSFNTCANTLSKTPPVSPGTVGPNVGGFNAADAAVAFGTARDGDRAVIERNACVALLKAERE